MKTIERLRTYKPSEGPWAYEPIYWAFRMAEKGTDNAHVPDDLPKDAKYPCRDDAMYIAEACNALPALLALVEAQAAEVRAWRDVHVASCNASRIGKIHGGRGALLEEAMKDAHACVAIAKDAMKATDAALRAMEGGAG